MRTLFVCVHNSGRPRMAKAYASYLAQKWKLNVVAQSAGTLGASSINATAAQAMEEIEISLNDQHAKKLTAEMIDRADKVVSMGCRAGAAACPSNFILTDDWALADSAGQPVEAVRNIQDQIREKVESLLKGMDAR